MNWSKTNKKYDVLYLGVSLEDAKRIESEGFRGTLLNEHTGPCYAVFLTDILYKAKKWGGVVIEVQLNGVETYNFFNSDYWYFYALADDLNTHSSWKIIEIGEQDPCPFY